MEPGCIVGQRHSEGFLPEGRRVPSGLERCACKNGRGESLAKVCAGYERVWEAEDEGAAGWIAIVKRGRQCDDFVNMEGDGQCVGLILV